MPIGIGIGSAVAGIGSSLIGADAARRAGNQQADAQERARADFAPWREVGGSAVYSLADLYGLSRTGGGPTGQPFNPSSLEAFRNSPDYAFPLAEGTRALMNQKAMLGERVSGNMMKELETFGQGMATQNFQNYVNRLMGLSGQGAQAASGTAPYTAGVGNAQAAGIVGGANAITGGMQSGLSNYMLMNYLQQRQPAANVSAYSPLPSNWPGNAGSIPNANAWYGV